MRVLIGFADALAAPEAAWSLHDDGFEVHVFARAGSRPAVARSGKVTCHQVTAPERDAQACADDVARLVDELAPAAVLPLDDHAVWVCDRVPGAPVAGPTGDHARLALDKQRQLALAERAGFAVPQTGARGPWMVKPALAVALKDGVLTRPTGRITSDVSRVAEPRLVQSVLGGVGEGVFGLATDSGVHALSAHRRVRMMNPRGSGSSACRSIPLAVELRAPVEAFVKESGWRGIFMIELLRDSAGVPWFMELNGRAWGSMALAVARGYHYPAWAVRSRLDPGFEPPEPVDPPHLTARHLGRDLVHLAAVLAKGGAPRLGTVLAVLTPRRGQRLYNRRRGEFGVFAADTLATLRTQLVRSGR
ncbi:hypothetical protein [Streptosporangium carneum]|uniref:ATP-grasp domain-containing protein n=1 Tax=Streptosporangium carneum TaxID=47481 RepID=A0A9W6IAC0_9ACTN|nr:hypothetical protein [Streptosporangium carneum]GLK14361.1 hypothetical protein GCM10017600_77730 [Streptosporangium carneum]